MAARAATAALTRYLRAYHLAPVFRSADRLSLIAQDGTPLAAVRLGGPADALCTFVVVHGLANWGRTPAIHSFAHALAEHGDVVVPDLRGHGRSGGLCTFGREEPGDLAEVIAAASDPSKPVVTVGVSLGGAIALLHAGSYPGGVAGVIAVSAPASWGGLTTAGATRIERWIGSAPRRLAVRWALRTRLSREPGAAPHAESVVGAIAPAFTVIAADPDDVYFGPEHARRLYDWATDPKELWWCPGSGHGTDLLTPEFAARVAQHSAGSLGPKAVRRGEPPRR